MEQLSRQKNIILFWFILFLCQQASLYGQNNPPTLNEAPEGTFTIAVMSDTQSYTGKGTKHNPNSTEEVKNRVFDTQTRWITDNLNKQNIIFVSHAGDVVDINNMDQWEVAKGYMDRLHENVPYGISPGNHDMTQAGNTDLYKKHFPASIFRSFTWYGGDFDNNTHSYQLLSSNGMDIIIMHIACNAPDNVIEWANKVLTEHKDKFAIITTHMFLGPSEMPITADDYFNAPKGIMRWRKTYGDDGNTSEELWNKCFKRHENIRMIISGDQSRSNAMYRKYIGEKGNIVHALLNDYNASNDGAIRLYRFIPMKNLIQVFTFNTIQEELLLHTKIVPDEREHYFSISLKLK